MVRPRESCFKLLQNFYAVMWKINSSNHKKFWIKLVNGRNFMLYSLGQMLSNVLSKVGQLPWMFLYITVSALIISYCQVLLYLSLPWKTVWSPCRRLGFCCFCQSSRLEQGLFQVTISACILLTKMQQKFRPLFGEN